MPKTKISGNYMENVKIFRGPTHTLSHLPQFAPDRNIYEYLPESNMQEFIRLSSDVKVYSESEPGLAKSNSIYQFRTIWKGFRIRQISRRRRKITINSK